MLFLYTCRILECIYLKDIYTIWVTLIHFKNLELFIDDYKKYTLVFSWFNNILSKYWAHSFKQKNYSA